MQAETSWHAVFRLDDRREGETMLAWWERKQSALTQLSSSGPAALASDLKALRVAFEQHPDAPELIEQERARMFASKTELARLLISRWYAPRVVEGALSAEETKATEVVARWMDKGKPRGLVLRGGVGVGKTVAAARWLVREIQAGAKAAEVGSYRHDAIVGPVLHQYDERNKPLPRYAVIDDVGRETKADFVEALCTLLDEGKHTLLMTTNLTKEQFRARYDGRLLDRLNDACAAVDIAGESRRRQDGGF